MSISKYHVSANLIDSDSYYGEYKSGNSYTATALQFNNKKIYPFNAADIGKNFTISCEITNLSSTNVRWQAVTGGVTTDGVARSSVGVIQLTFTVVSIDDYIRITYGSGNALMTITNVMLNSGSTSLPYEPYGSTWENAIVRKYGTASEIITPPTTIYTDGTAISIYTIKGNTVQNGTPTPSNPVDVNGVGERTENLFNTFDIVGQVPSTGNGALVSYNGSTTSFIPINSGNVLVTKPEGILIYLMLYAANGDYIGYDIANTGTTINGSNISGYENARLARLRIDRTSGLDDIQIMFNAGSTAKPYEPYGYKIPISSASTTTPVYLGEVQTTRKIKKYIFDGSSIFATQRSMYRNNTALFATTAMAGTGVINRPSMNNYFVVPSSGINPQTLDYACSGFHPYYQFSSYYYLRVPYDVIGMTDSNTDNEFITALNTWLSSLYNSGNPMIAYYALETPETATVNEPLMKIGTYADTLNNATSIPTTEGANSITVDTTVQPSEFTATWTGWHDSSVKEWDGSDWE